MEIKVTIPALLQMKRDARKIVGVVAWDYQIARIADQVPAHFNLLVGSAPTFYASLCVGARGGVLAFANAATCCPSAVAFTKTLPRVSLPILATPPDRY